MRLGGAETILRARRLQAGTWPYARWDRLERRRFALRCPVAAAFLIVLGTVAHAQTAQSVAAGCRQQLSADAGNPLSSAEAQSQAGYCVAVIRHFAERRCPQSRIDEKAAVREMVTYLEAHPERAGDPADEVLPDVLAGQGCGRR